MSENHKKVQRWEMEQVQQNVVAEYNIMKCLPLSVQSKYLP
jgi:hypothetical protein